MKKAANIYLRLSLLLMVFAAIILTGCGSNPAGTYTEDGSNPNGGNETSPKNSFGIYGVITGANGSNIGQSCRVTVTKVSTGLNHSCDSINGVYSIDNLDEGLYVISIPADDKYSEVFTKIYLNSLKELNIRRTPKTSTVLASYTVQGKVTDGATKLPVPYASIAIKEASGHEFAATTLNDGIFYVEGLTDGEYTLTFTSMSFVTIKKILIISTGMKQINFDGNIIKIPDDELVLNSIPNTPKGYMLQDTVMSPNIKGTGGINGQILDSNKNIVKADFVLLYSGNKSEKPRPIASFSTKSSESGRISATNLPAGFYSIVEITSGYTIKEIKGIGGEITGYYVETDDFVIEGLEVKTGQVTTLPEVSVQ